MALVDMMVFPMLHEYVPDCVPTAFRLLRTCAWLGAALRGTAQPSMRVPTSAASAHLADAPGACADADRRLTQGSLRISVAPARAVDHSTFDMWLVTTVTRRVDFRPPGFCALSCTVPSFSPKRTTIVWSQPGTRTTHLRSWLLPFARPWCVPGLSSCPLHDTRCGL